MRLNTSHTPSIFAIAAQACLIGTLLTGCSEPTPQAPTILSKPTQAVTPPAPAQPTPLPPPLQLAQQRNCMTCHTLTQKTVGPAWRSVAEKYKGQDVKQKLIEKVQNGGAGSFGAVAMPANASKISVDETAYLVDWILKGAPN